MKRLVLSLPILLALCAAASAADAPKRTSPVDENPACMDRAKGTAGADCTVQDGEPHRPIIKPAKPPVAKPVTPTPAKPSEPLIKK